MNTPPVPRTPGRLAPQLIGMWTLVAYTTQQQGQADTHPFGPAPAGMLIYTADGWVSAQLMDPGRAAFASGDWQEGTPAEYAAAGRGYIGYYGTYTVDEEQATVTHLPLVAFVPNMVQVPQVRTVILQGEHLILGVAATHGGSGTAVTSRLEWRKMRRNT